MQVWAVLSVSSSGDDEYSEYGTWTDTYSDSDSDSWDDDSDSYDNSSDD